jgi:hypothetical protein
MAASTSGSSVKVRGLDRLVRDFGKMNRELQRELRDEIKDVADIVSRHAKRIAEMKGVRKSGKLISGYSPTVRGSTAIVRNRRVRRGFPYPTVVEFRRRRGREFGPQASLYPAIDEKQDEVIEALGDMVDNLAEKSNFRDGVF